MNRTAKAAAKLRRILKRRDSKRERRNGFLAMQECLHAESAFARSVTEETEAVYDRALNEMIMEASL
jgi:hypothetical protein